MKRSYGVETWVLGLSIFMVVRGVMATGIPDVSEAYPHDDSATTVYSSDNDLEATGIPSVSEAYSHRDSATTLYSCVNYLKCTSDHQVTVTSTDEIRDLIKRYASGAHPVKIRATRRGFHSSTGFVCSGKRGSSYGKHNKLSGGSTTTTSITVLMHLLNRVVAVDGYQMTVEAGMTLRELTKAAEAHGLSVPAGALPVYANLTVGGVILTSGHGTGYRDTSSLGDLVTSLKWVNAKGEVLVHKREAREFRALVGGLGLLGIVTEVTLQLQPKSRTIVEMRKGLNDAHMVAELNQLLQHETPHVFGFWRPDFGQYTAALFTQVDEGEYDPATMPAFYPNGSNTMMKEISEQGAQFFKEVLTAWEDDVGDELPSAADLNANICAFGAGGLVTSIFEDENGASLDHATIPTNNAFVGSDCDPKCSFHVPFSGVFAEATEFTIKLSQFGDWVEDVKKVVSTELAIAKAESNITRCMAPGTFLFKFGQGNQNLLATSTGSEDVVYVETLLTRSALVPNKLGKLSALVETVEQLTLCKYHGRPHWGLNHERIMRHPKCKVRDNFPAANIAELVEMQQQHDPSRVFEPELFAQVLDKSGPDYFPLCSRDYWCYCAMDSHCPSGFQCRASPSFVEYKVCRSVSGNNEDHATIGSSVETN